MKRILAAVCAVSMFFTGCSSLMTENKVDVNQAVSSVEATQQSTEPLTIPDTPDYMEIYDQSKYQEGGLPAFQMPQNHSSDSEDIEHFQVVDLIDNKTFVYAYETAYLKADSAHPGSFKKDGTMVHALVTYDFESGNPEDPGSGLRILYEQLYAKGEDNMEEHIFGFTDRRDDGSEPDRVFLHDGDYAMVYDLGRSGGGVVFKANIREFVENTIMKASGDLVGENVKKVGDKYKAFSITNVVMDGNYRIYMELALEEEEIKTDEEGNPVNDPEVNASGDEGVRTLVLVYHYLPLGDARMEEEVEPAVLSRQISEWKRMGSGEQGGRRDKKKDWLAVSLDTVKTRLKPFRMKMNGSDVTIKQWKDGVKPGLVLYWVFTDGSQSLEVHSFVENKTGDLKDPEPTSKNASSRKPPDRKIKGGYSMDDCFMVMNQIYYKFTGSVDEVEEQKREIERSYTVVTGKGEERKEESVTERMDIPWKWKASFQAGSCLEGYWLAGLDRKGDVGQAAGGRNGRILLLKQGEKNPELGSIDEDGTACKAQNKPKTGEIFNMGMLWDGRESWVFCNDEENLYLGSSAFSGDADWWTIPVKDVDFEYEYNPEKDGVDEEEEEFNQLLEARQEMTDIDVYGNAEHFSVENLQITENGDYLLLTTQNSGIVCAGLRHDRAYRGEKALQLFKGTFYQSWRVKGTEDQYLTIGFASLKESGTEVTYTSNDIAHARLYRFDFSETLDAVKKAIDDSYNTPETEPETTAAETKPEAEKSLLDLAEEQVEETATEPSVEEREPGMDWTDPWEDISRDAAAEKESRSRAAEESASKPDWLNQIEREGSADEE